jgi:transposase
VALAAVPARVGAEYLVSRVERNGGRGKKTTIVAMARKLLVALWKYAVHGVLIEGAAATAA